MADIEAVAARVESAFAAIRAFEDAHPTDFRVRCLGGLQAFWLQEPSMILLTSQLYCNGFQDPRGEVLGYDCFGSCLRGSLGFHKTERP